MNVIIFLGGCGVGTLVVGIIFLFVLVRVTQGSKASRNTQLELANEANHLLKERNEIGRQQLKHMEVIAESVASHRRL